MTRHFAAFAAAALVMGASASATAAQTDADGVEVRQTGNTVMVSITPSADEFAWADDDGNGLISEDEVWAHRAKMLSQVHADVHVADHLGDVGSIVDEEIIVPETGTECGATYLHIVQQREFEDPPKKLTVFASTAPTADEDSPSAMDPLTVLGALGFATVIEMGYALRNELHPVLPSTC